MGRILQVVLKSVISWFQLIKKLAALDGPDLVRCKAGSP